MTVLSGIRVIEMAGLAPVPFCGMLLADFGADVLRVDRVNGELIFSGPGDPLGRGKRSVQIDLKTEGGLELFRELARRADVLLDSARPGVMERLGAGPEHLTPDNPGLVYARLTGYGQEGPLASAAGHDLNYLAISGALSLFGRQGEVPVPPANLLGDYAAGGLLCAFGVLLALFERTRSGLGQVVDAAMIDGLTGFTAAIHYLGQAGLWSAERGTNWFDSGAPWYDSYETADGKYVCLAAFEPQFFGHALQVLGIEASRLSWQMDRDRWPELRREIGEAMRRRTRAHWEQAFQGRDTCMAPVLALSEVEKYPHAVAREAFFRSESGVLQPSVAPRLSSTPGHAARVSPRPGEHTSQVLRSLGVNEEREAKLRAEGAIAG